MQSICHNYRCLNEKLFLNYCDSVMVKIKNKYQAESQFCQLFSEAGRTLNVPKYGESGDRWPKSDLSPEVVSAIHQCEFEDPHFIGGPGVFNFAASHAAVEKIFTRAEQIAAEICSALDASSPIKAREFRIRLTKINAWMLQAVK
jgi:hypothetical protein